MSEIPESGDSMIANIFGFSAATLSIIFFVSPIKLFLEARRTHCLKNIPALMFIANYLNCVLWVFYGFGKKQKPQWICNIIGLSFNLIWLIWYIFIKFKNDIIEKILGSSFFIISFLWTIIVGIFINNKEKDWQSGLISGIGYGACAINIVMYAAPGQNIVSFI